MYHVCEVTTPVAGSLKVMATVCHSATTVPGTPGTDANATVRLVVAGVSYPYSPLPTNSLSLAVSNTLAVTGMLSNGLVAATSSTGHPV